jgi:hypothetical protein
MDFIALDSLALDHDVDVTCLPWIHWIVLVDGSHWDAQMFMFHCPYSLSLFSLGFFKL